MTFPPSRPRLPLLALLAVATLLPALFAQDASGTPNASKSPARSPDLLVIVNGKIVGESANGRFDAPATLRNILDLLQPRYPQANIIVIGADDIVIPNLVLRRRVASGPVVGRPADPSLITVLTALSVASGRKFEIREVTPNEFVVERISTTRDSRYPEVFNLTRYINRGQNPGLSIALRETEAELSVLRKTYGDKHPRVIDLKQRVDTLKTALAPRSAQEVENDITRIMEMVERTLKMMKD